MDLYPRAKYEWLKGAKNTHPLPCSRRRDRSMKKTSGAKIHFFQAPLLLFILSFSPVYSQRSFQKDGLCGLLIKCFLWDF